MLSSQGWMLQQSHLIAEGQEDSWRAMGLQLALEARCCVMLIEKDCSISDSSYSENEHVSE